MGFLSWLKAKKQQPQIRSTMFPKPVRDIDYSPARTFKAVDEYTPPQSNDLLTGMVIGEMLSNESPSTDNSDTFSGFGGGDFGGGGSGGSFDDSSSSSDSGSSYDSSSSDSGSSSSDY